jgi:DNA-binding NtrC family response regulator
MEQETILVVDRQDQAHLELMAELQSAGYQADDVLDAAAAHSYLQARPDCGLVLSDIDLPNGHGIELLDSASTSSRCPATTSCSSPPSAHRSNMGACAGKASPTARTSKTS